MPYVVPSKFNKRTYVESRCHCEICESLILKTQLFQIDSVIICAECKGELLTEAA